MAQLSAVEDDLRVHDDFAHKLEDLEVLNQLAVEEEDEATAAEVADGLAGLRQGVLTSWRSRVLLSGEHDNRDAIVTVHAGAGGTDCQDWAQMLERMLLRWVERRRFKVDLHDEQEGEEAGIRSATFTVHGPRAYGLLASASAACTAWCASARSTPRAGGTRRSPRSTSCRCSTTSTAVDIPEDDLRIDVFRSSGPGRAGRQHHRLRRALTHLPTGIVMTCQNERSQLQNKATAMALLKAKLAELERQEREAELDCRPRRAAQGRVGQPDPLATSCTRTRWSRTTAPGRRPATPRRCWTATSTGSSRLSCAGKRGVGNPSATTSCSRACSWPSRRRCSKRRTHTS